MARFLKQIMVFASLTLASQAHGAPEQAWLAYGDLRGHLEPCGCDPKTDLGGIVRLRTMIARERLVHPTMSLFGLGNSLPPKIGAQDVRLPFLVEAEVALSPTAVLFNELERLHVEAIAAVTTRLGKSPHYVLSNPPAGGFKLNVATERRDAAHVVFGYVSPNAERKYQKFDAKLADRWRAAVKAARPRQAVLLFAGTDDDLHDIRDAAIFDEIISSNTALPMTIELGTAERDDENRLVRLPTKENRRAVRMVPWGGQGLLRGGVMVNGEAKPVLALLQQQTEKPKDLFSQVVLTSWLTPATGDDGGLKDLYARYQAATKQAFAAVSIERAKALASSPYIGAAACQSCHAAAVKVWQGTRHADAYATLEKKDKDEDPACVSCHVVGAEASGGFVSKAASPHLANVDCESCHGPRREHAANPVKPLKGIVLQCTNCHNAQHSPSFEATTYWEKIKHGL